MAVIKISRFIGGFLGGLLTQKALALWIFAGSPLMAVIWACALAIEASVPF
jgi:hypothetical protein